MSEATSSPRYHAMGQWVYRMQPAIDMPEDLFPWWGRQVADAIDEVATAPPCEPASLLDRDGA